MRREEKGNVKRGKKRKEEEKKEWKVKGRGRERDCYDVAVTK